MKKTQEQIDNELKKYNTHKENGKFVGFRKCPKCNKDVKHVCSDFKKIKLAIKKNKSCVECTIGKFKLYDETKYKRIEPKFDGDIWYDYRICTKCKKEIKYTSKKTYTLSRNIKNANRENITCIKCAVSGEKNPFFSKKHSKETKNKISTSRKGKACGENNAMNKLENREKVSDALKKMYDSGKLDYLKEIQKNYLINEHKNGKYNLKPISNQEKEVKILFEGLGYEVESQFSLNTLKYDLYLKEHKTLIEYNGDYWHCNPKKYTSNYYNKKKNQYAYALWKKDEIKKELALNNGYKFFTIWENDFKKNKIEEINKIISSL